MDEKIFYEKLNNYKVKRKKLGYYNSTILFNLLDFLIILVSLILMNLL